MTVVNPRSDQSSTGGFDKPITILRQLLTKVKDKDEPNRRQEAVYKIKCCECQATYIGETGRNLNVRLTEHKRATRNGDINNHIAEHHLQTRPVARLKQLRGLSKMVKQNYPRHSKTD